MMRIISLKINGHPVRDAVADNTLLIDYLRATKALTGAKKGCDGGECGACTVLVDGRARLSCITLAAACEGAEVETIEGQAQNGRLSPLQRAFHENLGTQCGFCTPGMIMAATSLLRRNPNPDDDQIKEALGGNLCRCTGYVKIIRSVRVAAGSAR
jgi:4-hydroxybenzoyl-CoA reductase subunit gamma